MEIILQYGQARTMKGYLGSTILALLLLAGPGCVSLSTFNTPETRPKDDVYLGIGVGGMAVGETTTGPLPVFYGRVGLGDRVDIGGKFIVPFGGISADLKYQLIDRRIKVAADLGGSIFFTGPNAVHPALLIGTDQFYVGPRVMIFPGDGPNADGEFGIDESAFSRTMPGVVVGAALGGEEFRVMPEVSLYVPRGTDEAILVPGVGLRFRIAGD